VLFFYNKYLQAAYKTPVATQNQRHFHEETNQTLNPTHADNQRLSGRSYRLVEWLVFLSGAENPEKNKTKQNKTKQNKI
jgi:hypothetical protein